MNRTIKPAEFGGYGKGLGGTDTAGGLRDREFASLCPPDIQPNTRILAVSGINDFDNDSAPAESGWFHSDFYLFHYLLRDQYEYGQPTFRATKQTWMACISPRTLVEKYKEFAHGDPKTERRVVLDESMLPQIENAGDIRVVSPDELLPRFLSHLEEESRNAANGNVPLLVLVFGHGEPHNFGISIGGTRKSDNAPTLTIRDFKARLHPHTQVSLVVTSCFSGGWVIKPSCGLSEARPLLNITTMTATGADEKQFSWAWDSSNSCGRATGSVYATALRQSLIKMEGHAPANVSDVLDEMPTYAALAEAISDTVKSIDTMWQRHMIKFGAQDDEWATEWRPRTGFPLVAYQRRWEALRLLPIQPNVTNEVSDGGVVNSTGGGRQMTGSIGKKGLLNVAQQRAILYLKSNPGANSAGPNMRYHSKIRTLASGSWPYGFDHLDTIVSEIMARLSAMDLATDYKDFLDLKFPDCHNVCSWEWFKEHHKHHIPSKIEKLHRFQEINSAIARLRLFTTSDGRILTFPKPSEYLAVALVESGLSMDDIQKRVNSLHTFTQLKCQSVMKSSFMQRAMEDEIINTKRHEFGRALREKAGILLGSLSLKRQRSTKKA